MSKTVIESLQENDVKAISRLMSAVENDSQTDETLIEELYSHSLNSVRIGITGPPGAGKSTLIDKLIELFRNNEKTVGVVSVDPTSPFSGGALLGDRIRMNQHAMDSGVYLRSMGSSGMTGGLARKSHLMGDILSCTGKEIIIFETIGVGQAETEIIKNADITVVVLVPEAGDEVQFMKAGPIEVGDLFVVNKSDRDGAGRAAELLSDYLKDSVESREFTPEIILTTASSGEGVADVYEKSLNLILQLQKSGTLEKRREKQYLNRVRGAVRDELVQGFWNSQPELDFDSEILLQLANGRSPYSAARYLINSLKLNHD